MDFGATTYGAVLALLLLGTGAAAYAAFVREGKTGLIVGAIAHVAVAIPDGGVGLIALVVGSRRTTLPARSWEGRGIPRSTEVVVIDMQGRIALVSPIH